MKHRLFTKNKILFLFVISSFIVLFSTSCTRKVNGTSVLKLSIPGGFGSSKITNFQYSEPMSMQSVSVQSEDDDGGANWNPALNPTTIADVNCYMVIVTGPEADMRRNSCVTTTGQNLLVGRWIGGIPMGSTLSLEVPSGPQREITIVGFKTNLGACTNFKGADMNSSAISEPHIIGKIIKDLPAGTVPVTIPVTVNASTLKIDDCNGPDFNMESAPLYFGDATPAAPVVISTTQSYSGMSGAYSSKIVNFNEAPIAPNDNYTLIETPSMPTGLAVNDEVMLTIQGANGTWTGTGNNQVGPCGYRAWEGRYTFARVMAISPSPAGFYINKKTFIDKLAFDPTTGIIEPTQKAAVQTNLITNPTSQNTFCSMKAVKVLHFYDLTINSGTSLVAGFFSYGSDETGILPIRVSHLLTLQSSASIVASSKGYNSMPQVAGIGLHGESSSGCLGAPTDTVTGGSCSSGSMGAGGGGHGNNVGSPFGISGGNGGNAVSSGMGGNGAGEDCGDGSCFGNLLHKIFLGGGGGSSSNPSASVGGAGGGIIYLMAKDIKVASGSAFLESTGGNATPNSSWSGYGSGGGGAGGSIVVGYQNLDLSGGGTLTANAEGGTGGPTLASTSDGGGGGGGGRMHFIGCSTSVTPMASIVKTVLGGMGGSSSAGMPGFKGMDGSIVEETVNCP